MREINREFRVIIKRENLSNMVGDLVFENSDQRPLHVLFEIQISDYQKSLIKKKKKDYQKSEVKTETENYDVDY